MAVLKVIAAPKDRALAQKLMADLSSRGHQIADTFDKSFSALVAVMSPEALDDEGVTVALAEALDLGRHIIPITTSASPLTLPKWIDHLSTLDFSSDYPLDALLAEIERLTGPNAPRPVKVLTPSQRKANRRVGLVVSAVAVFIFAMGLYMVGVLGLQRPDDEYDAIETERVEQRNTIIGPTLEGFLPRTTQEALEFPTTVEALPTRLRPFIQETATAEAGQ